MAEHPSDAARILKEAIVVDTLGGAVVHPTPYAAEGSYEESLLRFGWTAMSSTLVSEPSYTPTWDEVQKAIYENLINFEMNPKARHVERVSDIVQAKENGQFGVILGLQSPSCLEQDRNRIRLLHKLGLRVLQLTYMERNFVGDGCLEPENRGLTHFGIQVVRECNRLGILIDCSHVGIQTTLDAVRHSSKPIVVSHSAVRRLSDSPRNLTDEQMKAVGERGGTIGITAFGPLIRSERRPGLDDYLDHFDYAIKLVGPDHVTIATDIFDGKTKVNWATPYYYPEVTRGAAYGASTVEGFSRKSELINVIEGMVRRGYSAEVIKKILGGNFLRVLGEVWQ